VRNRFSGSHTFVITFREYLAIIVRGPPFAAKQPQGYSCAQALLENHPQGVL
jgi:hypothetical protein